MKSDLDRLMDEAGFEGLWITGKLSDNASLQYLVGQAHLVRAELLKRRGYPPVLYHARMETDEAAKTGLRTEVQPRQQLVAALEAAGGDELLAKALVMKDHFEKQGIEGRIGVFGREEAGLLLGTIRHLEQLLPRCQFVASHGDDNLLMQARLTKDAEEIARIRRVGRASVEVVGAIQNMLQSAPVKKEILRDSAGEPLTIGTIRQRIHLLLAERGLQSPSGPIFAMGRDGALGHSVGDEEEPLRTGVPIVFDLYPQEMGGGYYFDFTRTWCLGHAPQEIAEAHQLIRETYDAVLPSMQAGALPGEIQAEVCRRFETRGHATVCSDRDAPNGFFHAVAHGIGLDLHEPPIFYQHLPDAKAPLQANMMISYEPGLYYAERGYGVRLEDTMLIRSDGPPELLAPFPYDLVVPVRDH